MKSKLFYGLILSLIVLNKTSLNAQKITSNDFHAIAICENGTLTSWGCNHSGQLGDGTKINSTSPVTVSGLTDIIAVSAGVEHSLALKSDSTVWSWGLNYYGQLGIATNSDTALPVKVNGLNNIIGIAAGYDYSMALKSDSTIWGWGSNMWGNLGIGTNSDTNVAVQIPGLYGIISITAGFRSCCALKSDGTVWAWGQNQNGELGNGTNTDSNTPIQIPGLSNITSIYQSLSSCFAIKNDGSVRVWGENCQTGSSTNIPVNLGVNGYIAISGGIGHVLFLRSDGTVWTCGSNSDGQLGNGTNSGSMTPVRVDSLTHIFAISAGGYSSFALKTDGTAWSWGGNLKGQLGIGQGPFPSHNLPVQITGICNLSDIEEQTSETEIYIYPNPGNDLFNFTFSKKLTKANIKIFDITGVNVFSAEINNENFQVDLSNYPRGMYIYQLANEKINLGYGKLIIEK